MSTRSLPQSGWWTPEKAVEFRKDQEEYIRAELAKTNAAWRICSWHKNRRLMTSGSMGDEVGWGPYEACREGGAIVATGHDHIYARSHLMENFETQSIASVSDVLRIEKGKSFVFVSGLGGHEKLHNQNSDGPWWASIYTESQGARHGAVICTFNLRGVKNRASCYFRDIDGREADQFEILSAVDVAND